MFSNFFYRIRHKNLFNIFAFYVIDFNHLESFNLFRNNNFFRATVIPHQSAIIRMILNIPYNFSGRVRIFAKLGKFRFLLRLAFRSFKLSFLLFYDSFLSVKVAIHANAKLFFQIFRKYCGDFGFIFFVCFFNQSIYALSFNELVVDKDAK